MAQLLLLSDEFLVLEMINYGVAYEIIYIPFPCLNENNGDQLVNNHTQRDNKNIQYGLITF